MLLGGLLFNMFQKEKKESDKTQSTDNKQVYKDIIKPLKLK
jgi:hypothetical protein